jgi:hypothetical protein
MFKKDSKEYKLLAKLDTPEKIQSFLESIPFNHENDGETCMSAQRVLENKRAHAGTNGGETTYCEPKG